MPMADDDYRKRLVASMQSKNKASRELAFSSPPPPVNAMKPWFGLPGTNKFPWQAKNVSEAIGSGLVGMGGVALSKLLYDPAEANRRALAQSQGMSMEALNDPNNPNTRMIMESAMPGGGLAGATRKGAARLVDQIPTPVLQRAIQAASMEGKQLGGKWVEEGAAQGVKFGQSGVARAGRAGEDALFEMIANFERLGAKPQTLTRFLKGFSKYGDNPFDAMESMGENMSRTTKGFKEALVERMLRNIGDAAEREFF